MLEVNDSLLVGSVRDYSNPTNELQMRPVDRAGVFQKGKSSTTVKMTNATKRSEITTHCTIFH
jgi:hypothetical protein